MRTGKIWNKKISLQYMMRYGIVVMVTVGMMLVLANWILRQYKQEVLLDAREELMESLEELEVCLADQESTARELYLNSLSKPLHMLENSLNARQGIDQIKLYQKALAVNDYVLVRYQRDEIFTQAGSITTDNLCRRVLKLDEPSRMGMIHRLEDHSQSSISMLTDQSGASMLLYLYPMLNHLTDSRDMIGFVVKGDSLRKYLQEDLQRNTLYAVMLGKNGEQLFENSIEEMSAEENLTLRRQLISGEENLLKRYTYGSYESDYGFVFYYAFRNDMLFANFNRIIITTSVLGLLVLLLAVGMIGIINRVNVRRIKNVRDELLSYSGGEIPLQEKDEVRQIQLLIRRMYQEQKNANVVQEQIVRLLCGGLIEQEDILKEIVEIIYPRFLSPYYMVLSVVVGGAGERLVQELTGEYPFDLFVAERYQDTTVLSFVIGIEQEDAEGIIRRRMAEEFLQKAARQGMGNVFITAGRVCSQLCEISDSYQSMLSMTYYQLSERKIGSERIFLFETSVKKNVFRYFSREDIQGLEQKVREGTIEQILQHLRNMLDKLDENENVLLLGFGRSILAEFVYEMLECQGTEPKLLTKLRSLSLEDGDAYAKGLFSVVKKSRIDGWVPIESILSYIDTHYTDDSLGLEALAFRYKMSVSAVSRYIKEQSGQKYSEYISRLRLEEASRLLRETDMKLQEIPFAIGYKDYASFSKKFKAEKGMSCSEYRAKYVGDKTP